MAALGQWKWLFVNDFEFYVEDLSTVSIRLCVLCVACCVIVQLSDVQN